MSRQLNNKRAIFLVFHYSNTAIISHHFPTGHNADMQIKTAQKTSKFSS